MRSLSASEWLKVWEQGLDQPLWQRSLTLLAAACPEWSSEQLMNLSIGQRDGLLLKLREQTFGSQLTSVTVCPQCGDRLELTFTVSDIRVNLAIESVDALEPLSVQFADYEVRFRLPNSLDLAAVAREQDPVKVRSELFDRCLIAVSYPVSDRAVSHQRETQFSQSSVLPESLVKAILESMALADPQADVQLALKCPACAHHWQATFDIVSFFWSEIHGWAGRVLREVHTLASAYGWREADILAMSSQRRRLYLEMIAE
ncbi:MAG: phage baseplate protein [Nostoc sp.]|uniref:T4 family baseplate hub assembly chaperone n=1 Tax=Nostoc sp. TaxID=1180 RepID=UPI002FF6B9C1